jgi:hypothetical protein
LLSRPSFLSNFQPLNSSLWGVSTGFFPLAFPNFC